MDSPAEEIKEHGLLFTGAMINALRTKRQTRRLITQHNSESSYGRREFWNHLDWDRAWKDGPSPFVPTAEYWHVPFHDKPMCIPCAQYGKEGIVVRIVPRIRAGMRIWARETWWQAHSYPCTMPSGEPEPTSWCGSRLIHYAADGNPPNTPNRHYPNGLRGGAFAAPDPYASWHKRSSIHMPRWAARHVFDVTRVRTQRIQEITAEDAIAEGLACITKDNGRTYKYGIPDRDGLPGNDNYGWHWQDWDTDPIAAFRRLWDIVNGKTGPWDSNPRVWVYDFDPIETPAPLGDSAPSHEVPIG